MKRAVLKISRPYSDEHIKRITMGFEKMLGKNIDFTVIEDKSIIGGFVAYIEGKVYYADVETRLNDIKCSLFDKMS